MKRNPPSYNYTNVNQSKVDLLQPTDTIKFGRLGAGGGESDPLRMNGSYENSTSGIAQRNQNMTQYQVRQITGTLSQSS